MNFIRKGNKMNIKELHILKNIKEKLNSKVEKKTAILDILIVCVFIIMLIFNILTPLIADDYAYAFQYNNRTERITNIFEIIISQNFHYLTHGGRYLAHFLAQFFLMFNTKVIFNILNAFMYTMLTLLIYLNCNYGKKTSISLYMLINVLLWLFVPAFGQAFFWLTGSCNYLWTTNIILLILLIYRIDYIKDKGIKDSKINNFFMTLLGFLSGITNENSCLGLIAMLCAIVFSKR